MSSCFATPTLRRISKDNALNNALHGIEIAVSKHSLRAQFIEEMKAKEWLNSVKEDYKAKLGRLRCVRSCALLEILLFLHLLLFNLRRKQNWTHPHQVFHSVLKGKEEEEEAL